jgi:hypothetical protein
LNFASPPTFFFFFSSSSSFISQTSFYSITYTPDHII